MFKIAVIEDDIKLGSMIEESLANYRFDVYRVPRFDNIVNELSGYGPHLIILDINLPGRDGFHICREIREKSTVPILFISARTGSLDQIMALNSGGDDYLTKPFSLDLLIAKVEAVLRRSWNYGKTERPDFLEFRGMILDRGAFSLKYNGNVYELTKNEIRILFHLLENRGSIVPRDSLMELLWSNDTFVDDNTLTVNINRLRKKLDEVGIPELIKTRKGYGYIIEDGKHGE